MKSVVVLTTGGTISMRDDEKAGGAIPALAGAELSKGLADDIADVRFEEFSNVPSAHLTAEQIWNLSRRVASLVELGDVAGVVVTHGTDTLEETAYLCDLTIKSDKPIVFTGAMRTVSEIGYDGLANLTSAVQVAVADDARCLGTLVVFNERIHGARAVTKTNTTSIETFQSPGVGALGFVDYGGVVIERLPTNREFIPAHVLVADVSLLKLGIGMDCRLLDHIIDTHVHGVVIECLGGGRVPPGWLPAIEKATSMGLPTVITSRVGTGRTIDRYGYGGGYRDLERLGCWFGGGLSGQKARIKLMAALGTPDPSAYFHYQVFDKNAKIS